jgi:transposase
MRPYSVDLRERIVQAVHDGACVRSVAQRFAVSAPTVSRYVAKYRNEASLQPKTAPGAKKRLSPDHLAALENAVQSTPDATLPERRLWLEKEQGLCVSVSTVHRALVELRYRYKKSVSGLRTGRAKTQ